MKTASRLRTLGLLATLAAAAACSSSDEATPPEADASVDATLVDGAFGQALAAASGAPQAVAELSGTMSGSAQVAVYSDAEGWIDLGDPRSVTVGLQSGQEASVAESASVPAGSYTKVRLTLSGFHADLDVGSIVDGAALLTAVRVTMGGSDNEVVIEADVPTITLEAEQSATVAFDLNSEAWVDAEATTSETADDAAIQSATTATAETE